MKTTRKLSQGTMRRGAAALVIGAFWAGQAGLALAGSEPSESAGYGTQRQRDKPAEVGDPVSAASGAFVWQKPLAMLGGPMDLDFTLHYRIDPNATYLRDPGDFPPGYECDDWNPFLSTWSWQPAPLLLGNSGFDMTVLLDDGGQVCFATNAAGDFVFAVILGISGGVSRNYQLKKMDNWFYFCDPVRGRITMFQAPPGSVTRFYRPETVLDRNGNSLTYGYKWQNDCNPQSIADDAGRALYFQYEWYEWGSAWNIRYQLSSVTDHVGRAWAFLYDQNAVDNAGRRSLRSVVEPGGLTTTFTYRPNNFSYSSGNLASQLNLLVSVTDPRGQVVVSNEFAVNSLGAAYPHVRCIAQTDGCGNRTTLAMTTSLGNCMGTVVNPDGTTNRFVHHGHHDLPPAEIQDGAGQAMGFSRNVVGHFRDATDREGHMTTFGYDATGRLLTTVTNALGEGVAIVWATVEQSFDNPVTNHVVTFSFDQIERIEYPDGTTEQFTYDGQGKVTERTDRANSVWRTVRDECGRPVQSIRPGGGTVARTYSSNGLLAAVADSDGFAETYGYDALFRLTSVINAAGGVRQIAYDEAGRVERVTDELGAEAAWAYDANGNPTGITDPAGHQVVSEYDAMNRLVEISDAAGSLASRTYDVMGRLATAANLVATNHYRYHPNGWLTNQTAGARSWSWRRDADGILTHLVAAGGGVTGIGRDALGRAVSITDPLGQMTEYAYDAAGHRMLRRDQLGRETAYAYDGEGRMVGVTNALGDATTFAYDAEGQLVVAVDGDGHKTRWGYTPMGRLAGVTNALGQATGYAYDALGRLASVTNADGTATARAYDAAGRLAALTDEAAHVWRFSRDVRGAIVAATNPVGGATSLAYNPDGTLQTHSDSDTGIVSNRYDAARRLVETVWSDGASVAYAYNEHNELTAITDALGNRTEYAYDPDGRLAQMTDANGHVAQNAYDAAGQLTNAMSRTGGATAYEYDAAGRLIATTDPTGVRRAFARDALGRATNITVGASTWRIAYNASGVATQTVTPSGRITKIIPDALQRVAQTVNALNQTNAVAYDARGRITATTDPAGRATAYAYDPRGLLAGVALPDGSGAAYERDALGNLARLTDGESNAWDFAYSPMGRLLGLTDPLGRATTYTHDTRGQVAAIAYASGESLALERDANGQIVRAHHSAGPDLRYQFDALGQITNANGFALAYDAAGRIVSATQDGVIFGAAYDAAGRLASATYNNAAFTVTYTYATGPDGDGRLTRVSDSLTGTQIDFTYDADGRLHTLTLPNGETIVHTWDAADRLTRLQSGDHVDAQMTYDLAGKIVQTILDAPCVPPGALSAAIQNLAVDAAAQIASDGFAHDARGRVTQIPAAWHDAGAALTWDGASRLIGCIETAYAYDALGNVRTRTTGSDTHRFFYHPAIGGTPTVAEQDATSGAMQRYYVWTPSGRLLYLIDATDGNAVRFYHFDPSGNTLALTDTHRAVTDAWAYDPYGCILARTGTTPQPFTFVGAWGVRQDGDGGLYQMRARWYHAHLARFLSPEPIWPQLGEPKALNPYQYAGADPIQFADPSGLSLLNDISIYDAAYQKWYDPREARAWDNLQRAIGFEDARRLVDLVMAGQNVTDELIERAGYVVAMEVLKTFAKQKENPQLSTAKDIVAKNQADQTTALRSQEQSGAYFSPPQNQVAVPVPAAVAQAPVPALWPLHKPVAPYELHLNNDPPRAPEGTRPTLPPWLVDAYLAQPYQPPQGDVRARGEEVDRVIRQDRIEVAQRQLLQIKADMAKQNQILNVMRDLLDQSKHMPDLNSMSAGAVIPALWSPKELDNLRDSINEGERQVDQLRYDLGELRRFAADHGIPLGLVED